MRRFSPTIACCALSLAASTAWAAQPTCLELTTAMEVRRAEIDAQGREVLRLDPVEKIAAGDEVIYTIAAANVCAQPLYPATIAHPMPKHMLYVPGSAVGPAAEVDFSVDGGFRFGPAETLEVELPGGTRRPAGLADYTHVRWMLSRPLDPQAVVLLRLRAVVK